jgi:hypothetical protein
MPTKTKGDIVNRAYSWLRISGITKKPQPGEIDSALEVLEGMAYELDSRNICTSFVFEDVPDPDTESGIDNAFFLAASFNLGFRMAADFGKVLSREQIVQANASLSNWSARSSKTNAIKHPRRQPRGSGSNFRGPNWIRYYKDAQDAPISCETEQITRGSINDYTFSIADYLQDVETVTSHTVAVTSGLTLLSESFASPVLSYQLEAATNAQNFQQVQLTVNTSTGRKEIFMIDFEATGAAIDS